MVGRRRAASHRRVAASAAPRRATFARGRRGLAGAGGGAALQARTGRKPTHPTRRLLRASAGWRHPARHDAGDGGDDRGRQGAAELSALAKSRDRLLDRLRRPGPGAKAVYVYTQPVGCRSSGSPRPGSRRAPFSAPFPAARISAPRRRSANSAGSKPPCTRRIRPASPRRRSASAATIPAARSPASFYLLSYLEAADAGKYWIAPFIREGSARS